jgi:hypothetical protein
MSELRDVSWAATMRITRDQIQSVGRLSEFIGSIEGVYKDLFPSATKDINWIHVRELFHEIRRLKLKDDEAYKAISEVLQSINKKE